MLKVGICGYGKMGKMLLECAKNFKNLEISSIYSTTFNGEKFTQNLDEFFKNCEVIIDFSTPNGTKELLNKALNDPKTLIIGTTGLEDEDFKTMQELSKKAKILYASNFSLGVAVLNKISSLCAKMLRDFDCEIVETHHNEKKDAPSGTALSLAKSVADARELDLKKYLVTNREHKRQIDEISIQALRGGDVAGTHSVNFFGISEYIELKHIAKDRSIFANGALKCAEVLNNKSNGFYSIKDCL